MEIVGTIGGDWDGEETFAAGGDEEGFVGDLGRGSACEELSSGLDFVPS